MARGDYKEQATRKFMRKPYDFLKKNYVVVRGQGSLQNVVLQGKGNTVARNKNYGSSKYRLRDPQLAITNGDLLTIQSIEENNGPIVYFGLYEKEFPNSFDAKVAGEQDDTHPAQAFYLPARANQIVGIRLPPGGVSNLVMTDPLSGCTVLTIKKGAYYWMMHANALNVRPENPPLRDPSLSRLRKYMRNLFRGFTRGKSHRRLHMLDRPHYEEEFNRYKEIWRQKKIRMGRDPNHVWAGFRHFSVFGLKKRGEWRFYYQEALALESRRTGRKARSMGVLSKKFKMKFMDLPPWDFNWRSKR